MQSALFFDRLLAPPATFAEPLVCNAAKPASDLTSK
jgi:hypothetical protein